MYYKTSYQSPIGRMTIAASQSAIIGLWIEGQKHYCETLSTQGVCENDNLPILSETKIWLDDYFNGLNPPIIRLTLAPNGTPFQKCVWNILAKIPYGQVITYGDIAKEITAGNNNTKMSAQAVGGAVGHNHISVIIPCHRVIGGNGSLTGYAGGINNKLMLLKHEGVNMEKLVIPKKGTAL